MENIMKKLPLAENIKKALLGTKNVLRDYLDLAVSYQNASWEEVNMLSNKLQIDQNILPTIYFDALGWADSVYPGKE
jgi:EAL and modified HD-GYP domain-containing signal transduction protein